MRHTYSKEVNKTTRIRYGDYVRYGGAVDVGVKPSNILIESKKSYNLDVLELKSHTNLVTDFMKLYIVTINTNQYIGLPFLLTYTDSFTVTSSKAP